MEIVSKHSFNQQGDQVTINLAYLPPSDTGRNYLLKELFDDIWNSVLRFPLDR